MNRWTQEREKEQEKRQSVSQVTLGGRIGLKQAGRGWWNGGVEGPYQHRSIVGKSRVHAMKLSGDLNLQHGPSGAGGPWRFPISSVLGIA